MILVKKINLILQNLDLKDLKNLIQTTIKTNNHNNKHNNKYLFNLINNNKITFNLILILNLILIHLPIKIITIILILKVI